ncbi:MAG: peptidase M14 [Gammaproteobacteria bacterium RIFCSPHIGHO2_12_FULL_63_22]|nr:MAG: peptidase M14 [Gammaproteobacteria bacterium RIFCSPHIGHO2_12_FULL_63_22]
MTRTLVFACLLASFSPATIMAADKALSTVAERSGFKQTGRYDEVQALCSAFQAKYPEAVRCFSFGRTPEGRPMLAIAASRTGALDATQAAARSLPVLLVQGGIHAGEIDGKDAGFLALRQVLDGKAAKGALDKQVLLFVPVFNVDGHERFGRWNRPNQRGPEQMGWRTTAQNLNLNRDYMKADAPEMQAMLALVNEWDPLAYIDLHVTDGAKFEHDISVQVEPIHAGDDDLRQAGTQLRDAVLANLSAHGSLPLPFYPSFRVNDDPSSGFEDGVAPPRFSTGYFLQRNRFGMLVETHSWKDYPTRVRITRNTVVAVMEQIAAHGGDWLARAKAADARSANLGGKSVALDYLASDKVRNIAFRGYEYTRTPSEISGALMTRYDESRPQVWTVPIREDVQPKTVVTAPTGGYLVPAADAQWVATKLAQHGVSFQRIDHPVSARTFEVFRTPGASFMAQSVEGRQRTTLPGNWTSETRALGAGALYIPINQPGARLVMGLLEPQAPDSLAAWGEFNNAFEQKEYMEDYVAEDVARDQLAADPALAAEFAAKLRDDPEFAKNPSARLQFFARRHSSWDERFNLYPVLRTAAAPD